ncbi:hypothetical protein GGR69_001909 [Xanthomonas arboricola]|nr:hypothetical protein [Xanthomonas arboricola]
MHISLIDGAVHQPTTVGHHQCDRHLDDATRRGKRGVLRVDSDLSASTARGICRDADAARAPVGTSDNRLATNASSSLPTTTAESTLAADRGKRCPADRTPIDADSVIADIAPLMLAPWLPIVLAARAAARLINYLRP